MPSQAELLLHLQQIDSEIGRLTRQIDQLTSSIGDQMKVKAADYAIKQAEQTLRARQSEQREREFELATIETRIKDHEQRLYSGKGSPRDLQALQRDIEHDKERRGTAEEAALSAMDATEQARAEVDRVKQAVDRVLGEASSDKQQFVSARAQAQSQLDRKSEERSRLVAGLPSAAMAMYERLRQRMPDGIAVAEVVQGRCEGCRTSIPSAEVQRARHTEAPVQCSACQRILHVP
ncbi:MAG TPA: C4-type zinc ribbon domain-containing protein [Chloroflexota bacterium]|nr:C4-type zinc ribbon domain-containing protein [Chloroflexota bacterium]